MNSPAKAYICHTYYHLYLALLLSFQDHRQSHSSLIIVSFNRNACSQEFIDRLKGIDWTSIVDLTDRPLTERLATMPAVKKVFINLLIPWIYPHLNKKIRQITSVSDLHIHAFNDFHYICRYLFHTTRHPVTLIEDGNDNYTPIKKSFRTGLKRCLGIHPPYGRHPKVEKVFVQRPRDLPDDVRSKGELLNMTDILEATPPEIKQRLVKLFLGNTKHELGSDAVLILTQPYYDFGRITLEQHLDLYSRIVEHFNLQGYRVYLKPHPSDTVTYGDSFSDITLLPQEFPTEILNQTVRQKIKLAVGVNTTAVNNIEFAEKNINLLPYDRNIKDGYQENLRTIQKNLFAVTRDETI